ncbi:hypothetical protein ARMSODRAFT_975928 [Armillaria solidipes]|uniref:Uncharacterized protein n=1 Tax=Armillaria solidipes TaxID=1076256 RepID=A0A2H3BR52_9AGAR|nr:hypothetical protein ARMSODRAFT_975928 [Armillaria solidipes]
MTGPVANGLSFPSLLMPSMGQTPSHVGSGNSVLATVAMNPEQDPHASVHPRNDLVHAMIMQDAFQATINGFDPSSVGFASLSPQMMRETASNMRFVQQEECLTALEVHLAEKDGPAVGGEKRLSAKQKSGIQKLVHSKAWAVMGIRPVIVNGSNVAKVPDPLKPGKPEQCDEHGTKLWNPDWNKPPSDHEIDAFLEAVTTVVLRLAQGAEKTGGMELLIKTDWCSSEHSDAGNVTKAEWNDQRLQMNAGKNSLEVRDKQWQSYWNTPVHNTECRPAKWPFEGTINTKWAKETGLFGKMNVHQKPDNMPIMNFPISNFKLDDKARAYLADDEGEEEEEDSATKEIATV